MKQANRSSLQWSFQMKILIRSLQNILENLEKNNTLYSSKYNVFKYRKPNAGLWTARLIDFQVTHGIQSSNVALGKFTILKYIFKLPRSPDVPRLSSVFSTYLFFLCSPSYTLIWHCGVTWFTWWHGWWGSMVRREMWIMVCGVI